MSSGYRKADDRENAAPDPESEQGVEIAKRWKQEGEGDEGGDPSGRSHEHEHIGEARLQKVEREKEILKKATALLMSDSWDQPS